jgi:hypothetical protein
MEWQHNDVTNAEAPPDIRYLDSLILDALGVGTAFRDDHGIRERLKGRRPSWPRYRDDVDGNEDDWYPENDFLALNRNAEPRMKKRTSYRSTL